jgi:hypothetical protein
LPSAIVVVVVVGDEEEAEGVLITLLQYTRAAEIQQ